MPRPPDAPGSALLGLLRKELARGKELAADPTNAHLPALHLRVTTLNSPWFGLRCGVCQDRFRDGDHVRRCPACQAAFHDDAQFPLRCWAAQFPAAGAACRCGAAGGGPLPDAVAAGPPPPAAVLTQFLAGLATVWAPFGGQAQARVEPGSPQVGRKCLCCRYKVRAGDWVVRCPCGCPGLIHQDLMRHITCWNDWNGGAGKAHCPATMRPFPKEPAGA